MTDIDTKIDQFVKLVNSSEVDPGLENEVPPSLRTETIRENFFKWKIKAYDKIDWITDIEKKAKLPFPKSYKSLISRYIFPCFDFGPIFFLGNTPEGISFDLYELRTGIFKDENLSNCLLENGFLQFGRCSTGSYDPICFDTSRVINRSEFSIFRVDHESALMNSKISIVDKIAPSFIEFIEIYNKNKV